jgi:hypothetical protein
VVGVVVAAATLRSLGPITVDSALSLLLSSFSLRRRFFDHSTRFLQGRFFFSKFFTSTPRSYCCFFFVLSLSLLSSVAMSAGNSLLPRGGYELTPEQQLAKEIAEATNGNLSKYLMIVCGAVSAAVIVWKVCERIIRLTRHVSCLNNDKQRYFAIPNQKFAALKRHLLYAPVFSKRHNREIQLSKAINVGTLPTRFQLLFLVSYFVSNVVWCVIDIDYSADMATACGVIRNRTGVLSTVNMV